LRREGGFDKGDLRNTSSTRNSGSEALVVGGPALLGYNKSQCQGITAETAPSSPGLAQCSASRTYLVALRLAAEHLSPSFLHHQCRIQCIICSQHYQAHLGDILRGAYVLSQGQKWGDLCNKWELTWSIRQKALCSQQWLSVHKGGSSIEMDNWPLTSSALNPHITPTHTQGNKRDHSYSFI
jgi:hypothetical protein